MPDTVHTPERPSYRSRLVYAAAWVAGRSVLRMLPLDERGMHAAQRIDPLAGRAPRPRYADTRPVSFGEFDGEWVRGHRATGEGVVLYFHGGGFFFCGLNTHRRCAARISAGSGMPVLNVAYRQLPVTDLHGSITDCLTAYRWLLDQGYRADRIVFAGDSAGGYLSVATALRAREAGLAVPAGIVAMSALFEIDSTARLLHANTRSETYIPIRHLPTLSRWWSGDGELAAGDRRPALSPVDADLTGLPPTLLVAAESEVLRLDSELMAQRLAEAGVPCTLHLWRGQIHAFPVLGHMLPESKAALTEVTRFVRETVDAGRH
ncbi:alpha/beta hydrolase fold domain-containing protein [Haloechinothrix sp. LS1_15]|uniref:alpha/beta hydrolase fold domain-containing protein n=1 Tax=Haloechinothrix sp. LS1_15 TaxID=2652248 RepID=UPI0029472764|nr:alpha/beta hydrolase fold domain-containing protein [Haloechinothrix sp. LS1_15]MDV6011729.1 alpha/beta hydrolase [Haloechinothrix sp. LS1_15]